MRRRAKRDLTALLGVVLVLAVVVFLNSYGQRAKLATKMEAWRIQVEEKRRSLGLELLNWNWVVATKGSARSGATFDPRLEDYDGKKIDIAGFMTPIGRFRDMKEFVLLPVPIECYFCERPPLRHKVLIHMAEGETTNLYKDPMLINGVLKLQRGAGVKMFYVIDDARLGPGDPEKEPDIRIMDPEHLAGATKHAQTELQEGTAPPSGEDLDLETIEKSLLEDE